MDVQLHQHAVPGKAGEERVYGHRVLQPGAAPWQDNSYFSGCLTTCTSLDEAASAGNSNGCTGLGCCQILTPSDLNVIDVDWSTLNNPAWNYSPCSYALVAEKGWYKFSLNDLNGTGEMAYNVRVGDRSAPLDFGA
nr:wall-associated receptor kinase 2-like [Setaria viridis]